MKFRIVYWMVLLVMLSACTNKKKSVPAVGEPQHVEAVDSTKVEDEDRIEDRGDFKEVFYDFVFDFMNDSRFQRKRVVPALRKHWRYDPLFVRNDVYTTIFVNKQEQSMMDSCHLKYAAVELLHPFKKEVKRYEFVQDHNGWMLHDVKNVSIPASQVGFIEFLGKFVTEPSFRLRHIARPFDLFYSDSDNFELRKVRAVPQQWDEYAPIVGLRDLTNIDYGQDYTDEKTRYVVVSAVDGSMNSIMHFEKENDSWQLVALENN